MITESYLIDDLRQRFRQDDISIQIEIIEGPCFKCLDFITDKDLELEASRYGAVGIRQQVASINGILANVAVCLGVELLSGWTGSERVVFYKMLDGNILDLMDHPKVGELSLNKCKCSHYSEV